MVTLVCEIINKELEYKGFYNPAVDGYKKGCRNMDNLQKNLDKLVNKVNKDGIAKDYRVVIYEGKYEYYKNNKVLGVITKQQIEAVA